ncbi:hypothetical protein FQN53_001425 [Emmonsiellopsis sp. PD_33]|nr:hypothetical protein FQN53_001425 [Emmonsiellopsis sp. PD_33]
MHPARTSPLLLKFQASTAHPSKPASISLARSPAPSQNSTAAATVAAAVASTSVDGDEDVDGGFDDWHLALQFYNRIVVPLRNIAGIQGVEEGWDDGCELIGLGSIHTEDIGKFEVQVEYVGEFSLL